MSATGLTQFARGASAGYHELVRDDRVHGSLYTRADVFDDEMERIFHRGWVYIGHDSELPRPGDFVTRRVGRQPVIFTRDAAGELQLLFDRCPHRGNKICVVERGNASHFVCAYHGWVFDGRGAFVSMPAEQSFPDGGAAERSLAAVPRVAAYGGFVFASMAAEGITLERHLGRGRAMIDMLNGLSPSGRIRLDAGWIKHRLQGNWKGVLENQVDGYHPAVVHGSLLRANRDFASARDRKDTSASRVRDLGDGHSEVDFAADFRRRGVMLGWTGPIEPERLPGYVAAMHAAYGRTEAERRLIDGPPHAVIFPNLFLAEMNIMVIEPTRPAETIQYTTPVMLEGGGELNVRSLRRCEGALGPAGFLFSDDAEINDRVQQGLASDRPEWVLLKRGLGAEVCNADGTRVGDLKDEATQRAFWRHYRQVMQEGAQ